MNIDLVGDDATEEEDCYPVQVQDPGNCRPEADARLIDDQGNHHGSYHTDIMSKGVPVVDETKLETASMSIQGSGCWTLSSLGGYSSYSSSNGSASSLSSSFSRRGSLASGSRRSSLTSMISRYSSSTGSRRGSTASEVSNDDTTASFVSANTETTVSTNTARRRLLFGMVTTVEFDKGKPANEGLQHGEIKVSRPTESRWEATPVTKRKLQRGIRCARRNSGNEDRISSKSKGSHHTRHASSPPVAPSRQGSFQSSSSIDNCGWRRSSLEIKRPRRRLSVVENHDAAEGGAITSMSSLSSFLIPLDTHSGVMSSVEPCAQAGRSLTRQSRRGSGISRAMRRQPGSLDGPVHRASVEMPAVAEESSDEFETSAPVEIPVAPGLDGTCEDPSSSSSCLTDPSLSSHKESAEGEGNNSTDGGKDTGKLNCIAEIRDKDKGLSSSDYQQATVKLLANSPADIVTSVPFSGTLSSMRLSLVGAPPFPPFSSLDHQAPTAAAPAAPTRLRGSILSNLFPSLNSNSEGDFKEGARDQRSDDGADKIGNLLAELQVVRSPSSSSNDSSSSPSVEITYRRTRRRTGLVLATLAPRMSRRVPPDSSASPDLQESSPARQPIHGDSLGLMQSVASWTDRDLEADAASQPPSRPERSVESIRTSPALPKQPVRRPSEHLFGTDVEEAGACIYPEKKQRPTSRRLPFEDKAARRSTWHILTVERPSKSENDTPVASQPSDELPERAASEPSRRGSLLRLLLFIRTGPSGDADADADDAALVNSESRMGTDAGGGSTDGSSDQGPEEGTGIARDCIRREPRRRGGIKPSYLLRRYASCDGWVEGTDTARTALPADSLEPRSSGRAKDVEEDEDNRRSSMVAILPSCKPSLEPPNPLYRVRDNGQQATVLQGLNKAKRSGGHRRWSLVSNLPGRGRTAPPASESLAVTSPARRTDPYCNSTA